MVQKFLDLFRSTKRDSEIYWEGYDHGVKDSEAAYEVAERDAATLHILKRKAQNASDPDLNP